MGFATAATLISTGVSAYQGYKGMKAGDKAADQADASMAQQARTMEELLSVGRENQDFFRQQYQQWQDRNLPVLDQMRQQAMAGSEPDYAAITADTSAAFDSAREQTRREQERYGIKPGDGQFGRTARDFDMREAGAEIAARQTERRNADDDRFNKLASVYGAGSAMQRTALQGYGGASGSLMNALSSVGATHGDRAQMQGNAAAGAYDAAFGQDWDGIIDNTLGIFNNPGEGQQTTQPIPETDLPGGFG